MIIKNLAFRDNGYSRCSCSIYTRTASNEVEFDVVNFLMFYGSSATFYSENGSSCQRIICMIVGPS